MDNWLKTGRLQSGISASSCSSSVNNKSISEEAVDLSVRKLYLPSNSNHLGPVHEHILIGDNRDKLLKCSITPIPRKIVIQFFFYL